MMIKRAIVLFTVFAMLACPFGASVLAGQSDDGAGGDAIVRKKTDPAAMFVDLVAARPVGMASLATGAATFVVSLPFSLLGGNTPEAFDQMVTSPAKYTFLRSLGDM
ncbi:MAG: multidrug transporter [Thermodesulfobacteriota bacterium]